MPSSNSLEEGLETQPLATLPGMDKRLVPELAAALGPKRPEQPKRFANARDLDHHKAQHQAHATILRGLDPQ
jgi:hypothetical protein